jgi:hypothetical protein
MLFIKYIFLVKTQIKYLILYISEITLGQNYKDFGLNYVRPGRNYVQKRGS